MGAVQRVPDINTGLQLPSRAAAAQLPFAIHERVSIVSVGARQDPRAIGTEARGDDAAAETLESKQQPAGPRFPDTDGGEIGRRPRTVISLLPRVLVEVHRDDALAVGADVDVPQDAAQLPHDARLVGRTGRAQTRLSETHEQLSRGRVPIRKLRAGEDLPLVAGGRSKDESAVRAVSGKSDHERLFMDFEQGSLRIVELPQSDRAVFTHTGEALAVRQKCSVPHVFIMSFQGIPRRIGGEQVSLPRILQQHLLSGRDGDERLVAGAN